MSELGSGEEDEQVTHDQEATTIRAAGALGSCTIYDCPWPGPRPLRPTDAGSLIGRVDDRRMFQRAHSGQPTGAPPRAIGCWQELAHQRRVDPRPRAVGLHRGKADQWGDTDTDDLRTFLADRLGLPDAGGDRFAAVDSASVALVLDQFEELIRYSPHRAQAVFDLIIDLNRTSKTRVVVSFRSEYLHEFADLERRVMNFTTSHFRLDPVKDDVAENVVLSAIRARPDLTPLDQAEPLDGATDRRDVEGGRLTSDRGGWGLRSGQPGGTSAPAGVPLRLLWFASGTKPIGRVAVDQAIETGAPTASTRPRIIPTLVVLHEALQRLVDSKLAHCRAAVDTFRERWYRLLPARWCVLGRRANREAPLQRRVQVDPVKHVSSSAVLCSIQISRPSATGSPSRSNRRASSTPPCST